MRVAQIRGRNLLRPEKLTDARLRVARAAVEARAERLGGFIYVSRLARIEALPNVRK